MEKTSVFPFALFLKCTFFGNDREVFEGDKSQANFPAIEGTTSFLTGHERNGIYIKNNNKSMIVNFIKKIALYIFF